MKILIAAVLLFWLIVLPPFFTGGACTAEFDSEVNRLAENQKSLVTLALAKAYWASRQVPVTELSAQQCHQTRLKSVGWCPPGALLYISLPVRNRICRFYRDSEIRIQLKYNERDVLIGKLIEMNPFKSSTLPGLGVTVNWAK
jgi:hypothetical protein